MALVSILLQRCCGSLQPQCAEHRRCDFPRLQQRASRADRMRTRRRATPPPALLHRKCLSAAVGRLSIALTLYVCVYVCIALMLAPLLGALSGKRRRLSRLLSCAVACTLLQ